LPEIMTTIYTAQEELSKVFIDSDVIVAAYDTVDLLHGAVSDLLPQIEDKKWIPWVGVNILIESLTIVSQRVSIKKSLELLDYFFESCEIVFLDEEIINQANAIFKKRTSKNVSYSDCISFAIIKSLNIKKVFTFDTHFKSQGFEILN